MKTSWVEKKNMEEEKSLVEEGEGEGEEPIDAPDKCEDLLENINILDKTLKKEIIARFEETGRGSDVFRRWVLIKDDVQRNNMAQGANQLASEGVLIRMQRIHSFFLEVLFEFPEFAPEIKSQVQHEMKNFHSYDSLKYAGMNHILGNKAAELIKLQKEIFEKMSPFVLSKWNHGLGSNDLKYIEENKEWKEMFTQRKELLDEYDRECHEKNRKKFLAAFAQVLQGQVPQHRGAKRKRSPKRWT